MGMATIGRPRRPGGIRALRGVCLALLLTGLLAGGAHADDADARTQAQLRRGIAAFEDGLLPLAEERFRNVLRNRELTDAQRDDVVILLARALHGQARYKDVLELLEPRGGWLRPEVDKSAFVFWRAMAILSLNGPDAALAELAGFEQRFSDAPHNDRVLRLRATCFLRQDRREDALRALERFDRTFPDSPERAANLVDWGRALLTDGRPTEAVEVLDRFPHSHGDTRLVLEAAILRGRALRELGQLDAALDVVTPLSTNTALPGDKLAGILFERAEIERALTNATAAMASLTGGVSVAVSEDLRKRGRGRLGCLYLERGDIEHGRPLVKEYVSALPEDSAAGPSQLTLADALLDAGQYTDAHAEYQNYLESFDDEGGRAMAHAGKGWALINTGRYAEAAMSFERAAELAQAPERREAYLFKVGDASFQNGQYLLALEAYDRVITDMPEGGTATRALFQKGQCYVRIENWDMAGAAFADVSRRREGTSQGEEALFSLATVEESRGAWQEAVDAFSRVMQTYTNGQLYARALHGRGMAHYQLYRFARASEDFERVVAQFPASAVAEQAFYMRGMSYYGMMRDDLAVSVCTNFVARFPESQWLPDVLFWLGRHEYNHGTFVPAEEQFLSVVNADPQSPLADDALLWAGLAAFKQKEYLRSIETLSDLVKRYPDSTRIPEARFSQGDALSELGRFSAAILTFDEILSEYPDSELAPLAWGRKGDCQFTLGADDPQRYEESIESYRVVAETDQARPDLILQAHYKIGRSLEKLDRRDDALEQYYTNVILRYFENRGKGVWHDQHAKVWFTRAVFNAADVMETKRDWRGVVNILQKAIQAGVPAAKQAHDRIEAIKSERWWLFY